MSRTRKPIDSTEADAARSASARSKTTAELLRAIRMKQKGAISEWSEQDAEAENERLKPIGAPRIVCPRCGVREQFLPRLVTRLSWWGLRKKVWAVICRECKRIVGWER